MLYRPHLTHIYLICSKARSIKVKRRVIAVPALGVLYAAVPKCDWNKCELL